MVAPDAPPTKKALSLTLSWVLLRLVPVVRTDTRRAWFMLKVPYESAMVLTPERKSPREASLVKRLEGATALPVGSTKRSCVQLGSGVT